MKTNIIAVALFVGVFLATPRTFADFNVVEDRTAFFAAHPTGLVTETFEAAQVNPNATLSFSGPLNAATSNAVFSSGGILSGIELRSLERTSFSDFDTSPLLALGNGVAGWSSKALSVQDIAVDPDKLSIVFDKPQTVIAFDLSSIDLRTSTFKFANFGINFYSDPTQSNSEVASASIAAESPAGAFVGLTSDLPVRKIVISSDTAFATPILDNLAFSPVPEPTSAVLLMFLAAAFGFRRSSLGRATHRRT